MQVRMMRRLVSSVTDAGSSWRSVGREGSNNEGALRVRHQQVSTERRKGLKAAGTGLPMCLITIWCLIIIMPDRLAAKYGVPMFSRVVKFPNALSLFKVIHHHLCPSQWPPKLIRQLLQLQWTTVQPQLSMDLRMEMSSPTEMAQRVK